MSIIGVNAFVLSSDTSLSELSAQKIVRLYLGSNDNIFFLNSCLLRLCAGNAAGECIFLNLRLLRFCAAGSAGGSTDSCVAGSAAGSAVISVAGSAG